jgi:hypothetical protein
MIGQIDTAVKLLACIKFRSNGPPAILIEDFYFLRSECWKRSFNSHYWYLSSIFSVRNHPVILSYTI